MHRIASYIASVANNFIYTNELKCAELHACFEIKDEISDILINQQSRCLATELRP